MNVLSDWRRYYAARLLRTVPTGLRKANKNSSEAQIDRLLVELTANAMWRDPKPAAPAPDRGDDHLWALLHAYAGSILVTGDRMLLENPPTGCSVIGAKTCVDRFQINGTSEA